MMHYYTHAQCTDGCKLYWPSYTVITVANKYSMLYVERSVEALLFLCKVAGNGTKAYANVAAFSCMHTRNVIVPYRAANERQFLVQQTFSPSKTFRVKKSDFYAPFVLHFFHFFIFLNNCIFTFFISFFIFLFLILYIFIFWYFWYFLYFFYIL